jgi:hypothetical protein
MMPANTSHAVLAIVRLSLLNQSPRHAPRETVNPCGIIPELVTDRWWTGAEKSFMVDGELLILSY